MESFWSTLELELVYHRQFATLAEARTSILDYIETFYNPKGLHSSLGYCSPMDSEKPAQLTKTVRDKTHKFFLALDADFSGARVTPR